MHKAIKLNEQYVIELYAKYDNCRQVAEALGVSNEKVRRVLKKHGVSRTGNRVVERRHHPAKCAYRDNCYALFRMLYDVLGINIQDIATTLGANKATVWNACCKSRGIRGRWKKQDFDLAPIEREYLNGATTYELGEKYGVDHTLISKWMRQLGHCRGKGHYGRKERFESLNRYREWITVEFDGSFTLVESLGGHGSHRQDKLRCNNCGFEFSRQRRYSQINCPRCCQMRRQTRLEEERKKKQERKKEFEKQKREEFEKDKVCVECGAVFHSEYESTKYCSSKCKGKAHCNGAHRKRAKKYGVEYVSGITLNRLIKRDGLTCRICGDLCDPNDRNGKHIGGKYPTIDHIVAMKNGGGHTWDNVQVVHQICNSLKRDDELTDDLREQIIERKIAACG